MANMSYCRFQNTSIDLDDCVRVLEDAYDLEDLDLSNDEARAMRNMASLCREFLDNYERLVEMSKENA